MLIEQEELMAKIRNFNSSIMDQKPSALSISEFLNEPSPSKYARKKRKVADIDDGDNISVDSSVSNADGSDGNTSDEATRAVSKK